MIETGTIAALLALMAAVAVAIARSRNLFGVVVLMGAYSFLMATALVALDAADVAMTEAAVGAGISTVLLLGAVGLVVWRRRAPTATPDSAPLTDAERAELAPLVARVAGAPIIEVPLLPSDVHDIEALDVLAQHLFP